MIIEIEIYVEMGFPFFPVPSLPHLKKSDSSSIVEFCWNYEHIFICLPMMIEIEIFVEMGFPFFPVPSLPPSLEKVKLFIYSAILLNFETTFSYVYQ